MTVGRSTALPTAALEKKLRALIKTCPKCNLPLKGHEYRLLASLVLDPKEGAQASEFQSAVAKEDWAGAFEFQVWRGDRDDLELFGLRCRLGGYAVAILYAPFSLENPDLVVYQAPVRFPEFFHALENGQTWRRID